MRMAGFRVVLIVLLFSCASLHVEPLFGQQPPQRRPLLESLLRSVLEQQLDRARNDDNRPTAPPTAANMREAESVFREIEREVDRLVNALSGVSRQSAAAARLYDQAVLLRATATRAAVLSQTRGEERGVVALAEKIDRDWRDLEFRLKETFVANDSLNRYLDAIRVQVRQASQLFAVQEQFASNDAIHELDAFAESASHLAEAIGIEFRFSNQRTNFVLTARRIEQLAKYIVSELQAGASLQTVVRDFESLDKQWRDLALKLRAMDDDHVNRDLQRAEAYLTKARRILRISPTLDRAELFQLTRALRQDTDALFDSLTLNRLIELRSPSSVIRTASEFYGLVEHFELGLDDDLRRDALVEAFRSLDISWSSLRRQFEGIRDRATMHAIDDVDHAMHSLQLVVGAPEVQSRYDEQVVTSALTVLGRQLETEVARRIGSSPRYTASFRRSLQQELSQFTTEASRLNEAAVRGVPPQQLSRDARTLAERWSQIQMLLAKLDPRDRPGVAIISPQISERFLQLNIQ